MTEQWTDLIVGDRMAVDKQFTDRVANSQFSRQQWGLVMTAVEFEIDQPEDDERAELVAVTEDLPSVIPELDAVEQRGPPGPMGGHDDRGQDDSSSLLGGVKSALGLDSTDETTEPDQQRLDAAEVLVQAYATELQEHLEAQGKWDEVRAVAADDQ